MTYPLLAKAPPHDKPEFIDFLRDNNVVIFENPQWIVIENCKYHQPGAPWYTAFSKAPIGHDYFWWDDIDILWYKFEDYQWLKKRKSNQTVERFHIHLIK